jgi:hypothetical protein
VYHPARLQRRVETSENAKLFKFEWVNDQSLVIPAGRHMRLRFVSFFLSGLGESMLTNLIRVLQSEC